MNRVPLEFDHIHLIAEDPRATVAWYVEMLGAEITADTMARGAPQIFLDVGGKIIIVRGKRPGENPTPPKAVQQHDDFSSHGEWGTDHFGFLYRGDLRVFCEELRKKGVTFPVELKEGVNGSRLCYIAAPDGVSIELMQC